MTYPNLVPQSLCQTACTVTIFAEGISEDGAPIKALQGNFKCNYQDSAKTALTKEQHKVEITGTAFFCGDIAPDIAVISNGEVIVQGVKRKIAQGTKARNPDGTVNFTKLELI